MLAICLRRLLVKSSKKPLTSQGPGNFNFKRFKRSRSDSGKPKGRSGNGTCGNAKEGRPKPGTGTPGIIGGESELELGSHDIFFTHFLLSKYPIKKVLFGA